MEEEKKAEKVEVSPTKGSPKKGKKGKEEKPDPDELSPEDQALKEGLDLAVGAAGALVERNPRLPSPPARGRRRRLRQPAPSFVGHAHPRPGAWRGDDSPGAPAVHH